MKVYTEKISNLRPLGDSNSNAGTERGQYMIERSLEEIGAWRSITATADGVIPAGNHTLDAYAARGHEEVIVIETTGDQLVVVKRTDVHSDDPRAKEYQVADNRSSEIGLHWDAEVMAQMAADGIALDKWFFDEELDALFADLETDTAGSSEGGDQPERDDAVQKKWNVQPGQVWQIGEHRLACIDSTDAAAVKAFLKDITPVMVFADPPYGISVVAANGFVGGGEAYDIPFGGVKGRKSPKTKAPAPPKYAPIIGDETTDTATRAAALYLELYPAACQVWWGGNYYANALPASPCWLVWDKEINGNFADCELAWTNQRTAIRMFTHRWNGMLKASEQGQRRVHPTQKPIALAQWVFEKYAQDSGVIVDPFAGSGITLLAAQEMGRQVYAMEKSQDYCAVILERTWEAGLHPVLLS